MTDVHSNADILVRILFIVVLAMWLKASGKYLLMCFQHWSQRVQYILFNNISEDTQKMQNLRSTTFTRHKRRRNETNNDKTNVTCENTEARIKTSCSRGTALERSVKKNKKTTRCVFMSGGEGGAYGGRVGVKPVLLARNLIEFWSSSKLQTYIWSAWGSPTASFKHRSENGF